jgi:hypothetical protein
MQPTDDQPQPSSPATADRPVSPEKRLNQFFSRSWSGSEAGSAAEEADAAEQDLLVFQAEGERIVSTARLEAAELLARTIEAIDRNTALFEAAREKQENSRSAERQARLEAERELSVAREVRANAERQLAEARARSAQMISDVEAECKRQLARARTASQAEFAAYLRKLAEGLVPICDAVVEVWGGLDHFISEASGGERGDEPTIDLRQSNGSVAAGADPWGLATTRSEPGR